MTTLEVKLKLPDQLAREAQAAGLLTSASISKLLKNAMRRRAAQALLAPARRAAKRGGKPMTLEAIQTEVNAVRRSRKAVIGKSHPTR
jgi:post-segregation antitoxin (ccd killing protein)